MEAMNDIDDFMVRRVASSLILCHIFATYADCAYRRCYYTTSKKDYGTIEEPLSNKDLCFLRDHSYNMAMQYLKDTPGKDVTIRHPDMESIFNIVAKKIYKWLKEN